MKVSELKKVLSRVKNNGSEKPACQTVALVDSSFVVENLTTIAVYCYTDDTVVSSALNHSVWLSDINDIVKKLPSKKEVFFELNEEDVEETIKIICDKYSFTIPVEQHLPSLDRYKEYKKMDFRLHGDFTQEIVDLYQRCLKFAANDEIRLSMNYVCLRGNIMAATDAHILIREEIPGDLNFEKDVLLNQSTIDKPGKLYETISLNDDEPRIFKYESDKEIHFSGFYGSFPNFDYIYNPDTYHTEIEINRLELIETLNLASGIKRVDEFIKFIFKNNELNLLRYEGKREFKAKLIVKPNENLGLQIGFDNSYLLKVLNSSKGDIVKLKVSTFDSAVYINNNFMLMPQKEKA